MPLVWLFWAGHRGYFSADPAKDIQHFTGRMALKFLLATLLVSPLARYAKQPLLIRVRRLLGLWCFARATLHLTSYTLLSWALTIWRCWARDYHPPLSDIGHDQLGDSAGAGGDLHASDAAKTGASLATLHNFVYLVAILAPIHYLWSVKIVSPQPVIYALLAAGLLTWRYKKFRQWWRAIR